MRLVEAKELLVNNGIDFEEQEVIKNGQALNALTVGTGDIRPTIYERTIEHIQSDEEFLKMVRGAIAKKPDIDINDVISEDFVREHVMSCIRHETDDESIVKYSVMGDLEEYFRIMIDDIDGSIVIKNELLERIGISADKLRSYARANLRKNASIRNMCEVLTKLMGIELSEDMEVPAVPGMYVATSGRTHGASIMLLNDVLDDFCAEHSIRHLAIIPSSIHECLLLDTDLNSCGIGDMDSIINSVNETELKPDEVLSDHAYYYTPAC